MELEKKIREILELEKFSNLSPQEKETIFQSVLANTLILSKDNQDKYLNIISKRLMEIINIKDSDSQKEDICYGGIIERKVDGPSMDGDKVIFPYKYYLKYCQYNRPLGQLNKSILHEFGHMATQKDSFKLTGNSMLVDMGGLVISKLLKEDYGLVLNEIINEFTTNLSYKAFLEYQLSSKMPENTENLELKILPDDFFSSYEEKSIPFNELENETDRTFNQLYVKYLPLVKLMIYSFQNPLFSYEDLKREFEKGNGLSAIIDNIPINDLFYGYYESAFYTRELFNSLVSEGAWEKFNEEFDEKKTENEIDEVFITNSIELFETFYQNRLKEMIENNMISSEIAAQKMEEFQKVSSLCLAHYNSIQGKKQR